MLCGLGLFVATAAAIADAIISNANDHLKTDGKDEGTAARLAHRIREDL